MTRRKIVREVITTSTSVNSYEAGLRTTARHATNDPGTTTTVAVRRSRRAKEPIKVSETRRWHLVIARCGGVTIRWLPLGAFTDHRAPPLLSRGLCSRHVRLPWLYSSPSAAGRRAPAIQALSNKQILFYYLSVQRWKPFKSGRTEMSGTRIFGSAVCIVMLSLPALGETVYVP
jgi:hypothetical protein